MSYNIDRAELNQASLDSISNAVFHIDNLGKVKDSFQRLIDNSDFTGDGATAIKDYLQNVHITLITTINVALQEFYAEFALYVAGFSDYDSYENALLNEDFFTEISNTLVGMIGLVDEVQPKAATAADNVSDLITDYSISSLSTYEQVLTDENNTITSLRDGIGEYDSNFATDVLSNIRALITDAQTLIDAIVNKGVVTIEQMEPQQYFTKNLVDNLQKDVQGAIDYINENSDEIQDSVKFVTDWYQKKIEEEREAARRARIEKGIILVGTAVIAIGSVIITAGSDTPAALVVVTSAAEAYVLVDSTAKLVEGIQDIYYGSTGDIETSSVNFLRDSLYGGDQDAYDLGSAIGVGALGATASLGTIMNAGAKATSIGASVEVAEISSAAEETFKAYAGLATDYAGEKIAESCSDDPLVQFVIQTTIGGVADLYADEAAGALGDDIRVRATGHFDGSPSGYGPSVIDEMDDNNIIPDNVDSFETGTVKHCDADKYNLRTDLDDPNSFASRWSEEMREEKIFQESHENNDANASQIAINKVVAEIKDGEYSGFADGMSAEDKEKYILSNEKAFYSEYESRAAQSGMSEQEIVRSYEALRSGDYSTMAQYMNLESPVDGAHFWSNNKEAAGKVAQQNGGTIMEQTLGGQIFDDWKGLSSMYPEWETGSSKDARPIWVALSKQYAGQVKGSATYVHPENTYGPIWLNVEKTMLDSNGIEYKEIFVCKIVKRT